MNLNKTALMAALDSVKFPLTGAGLVTAGKVAKATTCDGHVAVTLDVAGLAAAEAAGLGQACEAAIADVAARAKAPLVGLVVESADGRTLVRRTGPPAAAAAATPVAATAASAAPAAAKPAASGGASASLQAAAPSLPGVKHVIAVGAGKGGVGKSTVSVNLAVGLALRGHAVGIVDGDIYGPSLPTMLGLESMQANLRGNMLQPFYVHGVKAMTIGKLVDPEKPLIWRGPMAHGAFKQLVDQTEWGELDYLIIDLPPGTGDVSLTMAQQLRLTGAVVVCTPQKVAQDDAIRALRMFQQLGIPVLGVVENMSTFIADDLSPPREYDIFGRGGAQIMAQRVGVPFLGAVPITIKLRQNSDEGNPSANFHGQTPLAQALDALVVNLESQVALAQMTTGARRPELTFS